MDIHRPDDEGLPLEDWPWRSITTLERRWLEKQYRKARCLICEAPLVCGQSATHFTCERLVSALTAGPGPSCTASLGPAVCPPKGLWDERLMDGTRTDPKRKREPPRGLSVDMGRFLGGL